MSSWTAQVRRMEAENRRQERDAQRRRRDLDRRMNEQAKLSLQEQARLEVEAHQNALEVLLSVQKEQSAPIEWAKFVVALPPHEPVRARRHEFLAGLKQGIPSLANLAEAGNAAAEEARVLDDREEQASLDDHAAKLAESDRMRALAKRVLAGEPGAYSEAISEFSELAEISGLGSSIHVSVHSPKLIGCVLTVNGREAIPADVKTLTAAGKVSVKAMPKGRFHEIYQDYVCGCVLRLAREMLALLPIETVLVTASVQRLDARTGRAAELPMLSVAIERSLVERLDFEHLDPSDSMENFLHRGDVVASRKSGEFVPIIPLTPADLTHTRPERIDFGGMLGNVRQLRAEIGSNLKSADASPEKVVSPNSAPSA